MSERHTAASEVEQQLVFDLMRAKLVEMFGPGGSFTVSMGQASADDALFVDTVAETIAWDIANGVEAAKPRAPRRVAEVVPEARHEVIWRYVEEELARRSEPVEARETVSAGASVHAA